MTYRRLVIVFALVLAACKEPPRPASKPAAGPQVRATVVTIRTTLLPEKRTLFHAIVIAGDRVRATNEHDQWRLFDVKADKVTFVDDVARTVRTMPVQSLLRNRRVATASTLPSHYPQVRFTRTDERRPMHGVTAQRQILEAGAWRRELWMAEHPAIPQRLFALMLASEPASTPLAPMMRESDAALLDATGFPLLDSSEVAFGNQKMSVQRSVVKIEQKDVPESLVTPPKDYLDLTPKPQEGKRKKQD